MSATVYDGTRVALKERLEAIIGKVALLVGELAFNEFKGGVADGRRASKAGDGHVY